MNTFDETLILHFRGVEDNPDFPVKMTKNPFRGMYFELPCQCSFDISTEQKYEIFSGFIDLMTGSYEASHFSSKKYRNKKAAHIFCGKDEKQESRLEELLSKRRAIVLLEKIMRAESIDTCGECRLLFDVSFLQQLKALLAQRSTLPVRNFKEEAPKKEPQIRVKKEASTPHPQVFTRNGLKKGRKGLPIGVKEALREQQQGKGEQTSDGQVTESFSDATIDARKKKRNKKAMQKKPNKGKAPNNIRKTKKPVKL